MLNILHISHFYLTHSVYFENRKEKKKKELPVSVACNTSITIKHILTECADLVEVRKKYNVYYEEKSLYLLFRNANSEKKF